MADRITKAQRRKNMQNIRSNNTSIENTLDAELKKLRTKYKRNDRSILGVPDFVFCKHKVIIFTDSCFWHSCPYHFKMPKTNRKYWTNKINNNKKRDVFVSRQLRKEGWTVIRLWEHRIKRNLEKVIFKIVSALEDNRSK